MSRELPTLIADNLEAVRRRLRAAAARSGRELSDIRLIAVTKYAQLDWMRCLVDAGVNEFGESRPQQLVERAPQFDRAIRWHLVGHLQRNKVRSVLPHVELIHSIDSVRLLRRVNEVSAERELRPRILLEVNVSGERTKDGFTPQAVERDWPQLSALRPARIAGLLTMAPASEDPQQARPFFAALRRLRDRLREQSPDGTLGELSMGMSDDFEVAIEEGATLVRIGSALFEGMPGA